MKTIIQCTYCGLQKATVEANPSVKCMTGKVHEFIAVQSALQSAQGTPRYIQPVGSTTNFEITPNIKITSMDFIKKALELMPEYIEETYPKGTTKERGPATLHITLFMIWLKDKYENTYDDN